MKIDTKKKVELFTEKETKAQKDTLLTFGFVMSQALLSGGKKGGDLSGEDKHANYLLASRIRDSKKFVELNAGEASKIKKYVGEIFPPITVGQLWPALDGK